MLDKIAELSVVRQCQLLNVSRSTAYYQPVSVPEGDLMVMRHIDETHPQRPFLGSRRLVDELFDLSFRVNRKRVQRLMRIMDIKAIYPKPRTTRPAVGHKIYPYLLGDLDITRSNQVWAADITYLPMAAGFAYLVAIKEVYLHGHADLIEVRLGLSGYVQYYNGDRRHSSLGRRTPDELYDASVKRQEFVPESAASAPSVLGLCS